MITLDDVKNVAMLAKLSLTKEEEGLYTEQLRNILSYIKSLDEIDTKGMEQDDDISGSYPELRKDTEVCSLDHRDALINAPEAAKGCFMVPKIID